MSPAIMRFTTVGGTMYLGFLSMYAYSDYFTELEHTSYVEDDPPSTNIPGILNAIRYYHTGNYSTLMKYRNVTRETYEISELLKVYLAEINANPFYESSTLDEKKKIACQSANIHIHNLIRRSMLRNNCFGQWYEAIMEDGLRRIIPVILLISLFFIY